MVLNKRYQVSTLGLVYLMITLYNIFKSLCLWFLKNSHETLNYTPKHETPPLEAGAIWEEISTYTLHNVGRNCSKFPLKKSRCEGRLVCTCTWAQRSQQSKNTERWSHDTYCCMTPSNYLDMLLVYNEKLNPKKKKKKCFQRAQDQIPNTL